MEVDQAEAELSGELDDLHATPCPEIECYQGICPVTDRNLDIIKELYDSGLLKAFYIGYHLKAPALPPDYQKYLASPEWKARAEAAKYAAGQRCQVCNAGRDRMTLDAHHRTYERLGREQPGDITVLCRRCHDIFHDNLKLARPE